MQNVSNIQNRTVNKHLFSCRAWELHAIAKTRGR